MCHSSGLSEVNQQQSDVNQQASSISMIRCIDLLALTPLAFYTTRPTHCLSFITS